MRRMAKENKDTGHKNLQVGQQSVQFEEAIWNCSDLVTVQKPKRKKGWNETDGKGKQGHGTQKLTSGSTKCSIRGSHLELQ